MSSTFRRRSENGPSALSLLLSGTKPWTGGITLTSSGLRDLDGILGSGQPLGTLIWLEEDRWTNSLALSLIKYWCAEALSQGQCLLIPVVEREIGNCPDGKSKWEEDLSCEEPEAALELGSRESVLQLLHSLPRNLHFDKNIDVPKDSEVPAALDTLEEEEEEASNDEGLKIAWQYRKSVQQERLGQGPELSRSTGGNKGKGKSSTTTKEFCHSYDLQRNLAEQLDVLQSTTILNITCKCLGGGLCDRACGIRLFKETKRKIAGELKQQKRVVRLLFYHTPLRSLLSVALPLLLSHIRENQLPVVVMVAVQTWIQNKASTCLDTARRMSDVVLEAEGFASRREYPQPSEFRMFHGLLKIRKLSTLTAATANQGGGHFADLTSSRQPSADLYGLKRDRRKLHIQMLHIPPEDFAEGGGSTAGVRSGAGKPKELGLACASSGGGGGALDF